MSEIYWLIVLGNLKETLMLIGFFSLVISSFWLIAIFFEWINNRVEDAIENNEDDDKVHNSRTLSFGWPGVAFIIGTLLLVSTNFIPSKTELYTIYGVGGAIDYLQASPAAQELPDKCINALNAMVDSYVEENGIKTNTEE